MKEPGMTIKLKKCHFFSELTKYLGQVVVPGKLRVDRKTTEAVAALRSLTTVSQIRSFLGLCNVYRRFVPGFAKIAAL